MEKRDVSDAIGTSKSTSRSAWLQMMSVSAVRGEATTCATAPSQLANERSEGSDTRAATSFSGPSATSPS